MKHGLSRHQGIRWPVLVGLLLSLNSCGDGRPQRFGVTGVVTYRGKPVGDAQVMFLPQGGRPALGVTNADGRFELASLAMGDGAIVGEHVVCVATTVPDPTSDSKSPYGRTLSVTPNRYANPKLSPLKATVSASGPNEFQFDLTD